MFTEIDQWNHNGGVLFCLWKSDDPARAQRTVYCWNEKRSAALQHGLDSVTLSKHKHVHPHVWPVRHPGRELWSAT